LGGLWGGGVVGWGCGGGGGWVGGFDFAVFFGAFLKAAFWGVWFYGHHDIVELFGAFGFEWWCTTEADRSELSLPLSLSLSVSVSAEKQPAALEIRRGRTTARTIRRRKRKKRTPGNSLRLRGGGAEQQELHCWRFVFSEVSLFSEVFFARLWFYPRVSAAFLPFLCLFFFCFLFFCKKKKKKKKQG